MVIIIKVLRKDYQDAGELSLCSKAGNIINKCRVGTTYATFKPLVDDIEAKLLIYQPLVDLGKAPGKSVTTAKKTAKPALIAAINLLANAIDETPGVTTQFIVDAGFVTYKTPTSHETPIQSPIKVSVMSTGIAGELKVTFEVPDPTQVYLNVIWLSFDNGATWSDYYTKKSIITITGLTSGDKAIVKVRTVGTNKRKSPWANGDKPAYVN